MLRGNEHKVSLSLSTSTLRRRKVPSNIDTPVTVMGAFSVAPAVPVHFSGDYRPIFDRDIGSVVAVDRTTGSVEVSQGFSKKTSKLYANTSDLGRMLFQKISSASCVIFAYIDMTLLLQKEHQAFFKKMKECKIPVNLFGLTRPESFYYGRWERGKPKGVKPLEQESTILELLQVWTRHDGPNWVFINNSFIGTIYQLEGILTSTSLKQLVDSCVLQDRNLWGQEKVYEKKNTIYVQDNPSNPMNIEALAQKQQKYDFDFCVIGGGNAGLAAARTAALGGLKTVLFDYVPPTHHGHTWAVGGTCLMVGCIPKKSIHYASEAPMVSNFFETYLWKVGHVEQPAFDFPTMVSNVRDHLGGGSYSYKQMMKNANITFHNAWAKFDRALPGNFCVVEAMKKKKKLSFKCRTVLVATGMRPLGMSDDINKLALTTDDFFFLKYAPGKTVIVGASYSAVEIAGILINFGYDVTLLVRSKLLRGFDREMVSRLSDHLEFLGVKMMFDETLDSIVELEQVKKNQQKKLLAKVKNVKTGEITDIECNTVVLSIGRETRISDLNYEGMNVNVNPRSKRIVAYYQRTNIPAIYAAGDVLDDSAQRAPIASAEGAAVGSRISDVYHEPKFLFSFTSAIFSPMPYAYFGMSTEDALYEFSIDTVIHEYKKEFCTPQMILEEIHHGKSFKAFCKCITIEVQAANGKTEEHVYGVHIMAPNAETIINGLTVILILHCSKSELLRLSPACGVGYSDFIAKTLAGPRSTTYTSADKPPDHKEHKRESSGMKGAGELYQQMPIQ